jgi:hypothetical protein
MNDLSSDWARKTLVFFTATLCLLAAMTQAEDAVPLSVKVISVTGAARYVTTNSAKGSWTALRVGDELRAVSVLQTDSRGSSTADVELIGPDGRGWGKIRMFSNCVVEPRRLDLKKSASGQAMDVRLDVPVGQVQIRLDGGSDYAFALGAMRVTPAGGGAASAKETVFLFAPPSSLSVIKGAVTASFGSGAEKLVRAGEQFRGDNNELTKLSPDAPELKLGE